MVYKCFKSFKKEDYFRIVLPHMYDKVYAGTGVCSSFGSSNSYVNISNYSVVTEFNHNYCIPHNKFAWYEDERFCVLVKYEDFAKDPEKYIDLAFDKSSHLKAEKTKFRP